MPSSEAGTDVLTQEEEENQPKGPTAEPSRHP